MRHKIVISGKMCSGKSTLANYLVEKHSFVRSAFASRLKQMGDIISTCNAKPEDTDARLWARFVLDEICEDAGLPPESWTRAPDALEWAFYEFGDVTDYRYDVIDGSEKKSEGGRRLLQGLGDGFRERIHPEIWLRSAYIGNDPGDERNIVIDDARYPNELQYLKDNGFTSIRAQISAETQRTRIQKLYGEISQARLQHPTETALDDSEFDLYLPIDVPLEVAHSILDQLVHAPMAMDEDPLEEV